MRIIEDKPIDLKMENRRLGNELSLLRQKNEELKKDRDYIKSLLDVEYKKRIKLKKENKQLKQEKQSKRKPKYIHQHIIRITYPYQTDVENTKYMIKHIKSVITRETGVEPTIEEYLL